MNRPEVICHMASTIDGKIAGESFGAEGLGPYLEFYGKKKQTFKANATAYGASTTKEIFVGKGKENFKGTTPLQMNPILSAVKTLLTLLSPLIRSAKFHGNQESLREDRDLRKQESSSLHQQKLQKNILVF